MYNDSVIQEIDESSLCSGNSHIVVYQLRDKKMKHSKSAMNTKKSCSHLGCNMIPVNKEEKCKKHHVPKICNHPGCGSNISGCGQFCKSHKSKKQKTTTVAQDTLDSVMKEVV